MIKLTTTPVDMPPFQQRRYQKKESGHGQWRCVDTKDGSVKLRGPYESVVRACHMYNKEYYQENPFVTSEESPV